MPAKNWNREGLKMLHGTRLGLVLKHIAKNPDKYGSTISSLARITRLGNLDSLGYLHDALEEAGAHNEHAQKLSDMYNFRGAMRGLNVDQAVIKANNYIQANNVNRLASVNPDTLLHITTRHVTDNKDFAARYPEVANTAAHRYRTLLYHVKEAMPDITNEELNNSLLRIYRNRMDNAYVNDLRSTLPRSERKKHMDNFALGNLNDPVDREAQVNATRHKLQRLRQRLKYSANQQSSFIAALRRLRSQSQISLHDIAAQIHNSLNLEPTKIKDVIHDSQLHGAVNSTAQAIYHNSDPDTVRYAAAWYGHLAQLPSVGIFHVTADGPDSLYKFKLNGQVDNIRRSLDQHGITQRLMIPDGEGYQVMVYDHGRKLKKNLERLLHMYNTSAEVSNGIGEVIGNSDGAKADADTRQDYRSIIESYEAGHLNNG